MGSLLEEVAPPSAYPVSLAAAKAWLREPSSDWDSDITDLLQAAVVHAETISKNIIVYRTVRERFDVFRPVLELSGFPVRAIQSIKYLDTAGVEQTLDSTKYRVDIFNGQARVTPEYAQFFPPTRIVMNAITITYDVGRLVPITAVDTAGDVLTAPGHNFAAGDQLQLSTDGTGVLPTPLAASTTYYVVNPTSSSLQLSATSGGAAIDITAAGTKPFFLGLLDTRIKMALRLMLNAWSNFPSGLALAKPEELPVPYGVLSLLMALQPRGF
jgi:uncharacterized phiE125 gp8 family phage protein